MAWVAAAAWAAQGQASAKSPACLVLMHTAVKGEPKADARMKHFALPDPKLRARLKKLGFEVGVAPYAPWLDMAFLKQFNVIVMEDFPIVEKHPTVVDAIREKEKLLARFVAEGGGILFTGMAEWRMSNVVAKSECFYKILVQ